MLSFPESESFGKKDDKKALADYLVRRLYGRKLSDFEISESFEIEGIIATLHITENGSEISSRVMSADAVVEIFKQINGVQEQIKTARENIEQLKGPGMLEMAKNAIGAAKRFAQSGFAMASDEEFKRRMEICVSCEFWDSAARMGIGKCAKCGCTSSKLRLASEKCPLEKWNAIP